MALLNIRGLILALAFLGVVIPMVTAAPEADPEPHRRWGWGGGWGGYGGYGGYGGFGGYGYRPWGGYGGFWG